MYAALTVDALKESVMSIRNFIIDRHINSIDIDQISGNIIVTNPFDDDGTIGGRIAIYPASNQLQVNQPVYIDGFTQTREFYARTLHYPLDARCDYLRGKIWVADTGNNRLIKFDQRTLEMNAVVENQIIYPFALAVDLNTGGVCARGFYGSTNTKIVMHFNTDGSVMSSFIYENTLAESSSSTSSSSESSLSSGLSETSTSYSGEVFPAFPSSKSIVFDSIRNRIWWTNNNKVYMVDESNHQINTYNIDPDWFLTANEVDIDLSTGNAFVIAKNLDGSLYLLQIFKDNNRLLSISYLNR